MLSLLKMRRSSDRITALGARYGDPLHHRMHCNRVLDGGARASPADDEGREAISRRPYRFVRYGSAGQSIKGIQDFAIGFLRAERADLSPMNEERRDHQRVPILVDGTILMRNGSLYPCRIKDVSRGGALIAFTHADKLPKRFFVMIGEAGAAREVVVSWRRDGEVGVQFVARQD